jgi:hypothetical protein
MGGDLKNGAAHEPAISPADVAGRLWLCGSVCDTDHGSAGAHPDVGDHATAAPELNARAMFPSGLVVVIAIDMLALLTPRTPDAKVS